MELSKSGTSITLEIFAEEEELGTLIIGRGSMTWYGSRWKNGRKFLLAAVRRQDGGITRARQLKLGIVSSTSR